MSNISSRNSASLGLDTERHAQRQSRTAEVYCGGDVITMGARCCPSCSWSC
jgi:hypothetical protein